MADNNEYTLKGCTELISQFQKSQERMGDISFIIDGGANQLDPIETLRYYQAKRDIATDCELVDKLTAGKTFAVYYNNPETGDSKEIMRHTRKLGEPLARAFTGYIWLLEVFINVCYAIILERLTPSSSCFEQSETA